MHIFRISSAVNGTLSITTSLNSTITFKFNGVERFTLLSHRCEQGAAVMITDCMLAERSPDVGSAV